VFWATIFELTALDRLGSILPLRVGALILPLISRIPLHQLIVEKNWVHHLTLKSAITVPDIVWR
jgi:hypothetical protein